MDALTKQPLFVNIAQKNPVARFASDLGNKVKTGVNNLATNVYNGVNKQIKESTIFNPPTNGQVMSPAQRDQLMNMATSFGPGAIGSIERNVASQARNSFGKWTKAAIKDFAEVHPEDQLFLNKFVEKVKSKVPVPEKLFNQVRDTLQHYNIGIPAGENMTKVRNAIANHIENMSQSSQSVKFNKELDTNLSKRVRKL